MTVELLHRGSRLIRQQREQALTHIGGKPRDVLATPWAPDGQDSWGTDERHRIIAQAACDELAYVGQQDPDYLEAQADLYALLEARVQPIDPGLFAEIDAHIGALIAAAFGGMARAWLIERGSIPVRADLL